MPCFLDTHEDLFFPKQKQRRRGLGVRTEKGKIEGLGEGPGKEEGGKTAARMQNK